MTNEKDAANVDGTHNTNKMNSTSTHSKLNDILPSHEPPEIGETSSKIQDTIAPGSSPLDAINPTVSVSASAKHVRPDKVIPDGRSKLSKEVDAGTAGSVADEKLPAAQVLDKSKLASKTTSILEEKDTPVATTVKDSVLPTNRKVNDKVKTPTEQTRKDKKSNSETARAPSSSNPKTTPVASETHLPSQSQSQRSPKVQHNSPPPVIFVGPSSANKIASVVVNERKENSSNCNDGKQVPTIISTSRQKSSNSPPTKPSSDRSKKHEQTRYSTSVDSNKPVANTDTKSSRQEQKGKNSPQDGQQPGPTIILSPSKPKSFNSPPPTKPSSVRSTKSETHSPSVHSDRSNNNQSVASTHSINQREQTSNNGQTQWPTTMVSPSRQQSSNPPTRPSSVRSTKSDLSQNRSPPLHPRRPSNLNSANFPGAPPFLQVASSTKPPAAATATTTTAATPTRHGTIPNPSPRPRRGSGRLHSNSPSNRSPSKPLSLNNTNRPRHVSPFKNKSAPPTPTNRGERQPHLSMSQPIYPSVPPFNTGQENRMVGTTTAIQIYDDRPSLPTSINNRDNRSTTPRPGQAMHGGGDRQPISLSKTKQQQLHPATVGARPFRPTRPQADVATNRGAIQVYRPPSGNTTNHNTNRNVWPYNNKIHPHPHQHQPSERRTTNTPFKARRPFSAKRGFRPDRRPGKPINNNHNNNNNNRRRILRYEFKRNNKVNPAPLGPEQRPRTVVAVPSDHPKKQGPLLLNGEYRIMKVYRAPRAQATTLAIVPFHKQNTNQLVPMNVQNNHQHDEFHDEEQLLQDQKESIHSYKSLEAAAVRNASSNRETPMSDKSSSMTKRHHPVMVCSTMICYTVIVAAFVAMILTIVIGGPTFQTPANNRPTSPQAPYLRDPDNDDGEVLELSARHEEGMEIHSPDDDNGNDNENGDLVAAVPHEDGEDASSLLVIPSNAIVLRNEIETTFLLSQRDKAWFEHEDFAERSCGGHLASITNEDEWNTVQALLETFFLSSSQEKKEQQRGVWIGGYQTEEKPEEWRNPEPDPTLDFRWSDGSSPSFFATIATTDAAAQDFWAKGQPNDMQKVFNDSKEDGHNRILLDSNGLLEDEYEVGRVGRTRPAVLLLPIDYNDTVKYPFCTF